MNNQQISDLGALEAQVRWDRESLEKAEAIVVQRRAALAASEQRAEAFKAAHAVTSG